MILWTKTRKSTGAHLVSVVGKDVSAQVVIVDDSADSREVLHTLLENRGVSSVEVRGAREGMDLIRHHHPAVVIFDLETEEVEGRELEEELASTAREHHAALVVLGRARRYLEALPGDQVISKPYHYGPLIRTIERLLVQ